MLAKVLSLAGLAMLFACTPTTTQENHRMLNEETAHNYANAWARKVHANLQDLKQSDGAGFYGMLGSLGFEYLPKENTLAIRAYIFPWSAKLTGKPDLLPYLNRLATEDPESVSHGVFETCKAPWEPEKEPSLFLRINLNDGNQSESAVVSRFEKLRDDAMVWRRNKFTKALDALRIQRQQRRP